MLDNASAQNLCGRCASARIDLTLSTRVRFILSARPFCFGVLGTVYRDGGRSWQLEEQIASAKREQEKFFFLIFIKVGFNAFGASS